MIPGEKMMFACDEGFHALHIDEDFNYRKETLAIPAQKELRQCSMDKSKEFIAFGGKLLFLVPICSYASCCQDIKKLAVFLRLMEKRY